MEANISQLKQDNRICIDSFEFKKDEFYIFFERTEKKIHVKLIKNTNWYIGETSDLDEEDIIFSWDDISQGNFDVRENHGKPIKLLAKGLNISLNLDQETSIERREIYDLKMKNQMLKAEIEHLKQNINNIIWVTVYTDNVRREFKQGDIVVKFIVNKKFPTSILLIKGVICVHGESNAETGQYWTYGGKTVSYGQTESYSNNSGYGRPVVTSTVISNHQEVGSQELVLTFNRNILPFTVINPNNLDHQNYYDVQTQSVYTVWEIKQ